MSVDEALRPIPIGNAVSVEATASDPLSAARLALVQLAERTPTSSMASISVTSVIIDPAEDQPWEATAYASLVE